jgi:hypothetical protein
MRGKLRHRKSLYRPGGSHERPTHSLDQSTPRRRIECAARTRFLPLVAFGVPSDPNPPGTEAVILVVSQRVVKAASTMLTPRNYLPDAKIGPNKFGMELGKSRLLPWCFPTVGMSVGEGANGHPKCPLNG